jgi:hypothetical protein
MIWAGPAGIWVTELLRLGLLFSSAGWPLILIRSDPISHCTFKQGSGTGVGTTGICQGQPLTMAVSLWTRAN